MSVSRSSGSQPPGRALEPVLMLLPKRGARSRNAAGSHFSQRSAGSIMCESAEIRCSRSMSASVASATGASLSLGNGMGSSLHRNLVETHGVSEDHLLERRFPERCLHRSMAHLPGVRPGTIEAGEVAGPEEILHTHLGHAPKAAFLLDLEREEDLTLHELGRLVGQHDVGAEDARGWTAPVILAIEAPEQERDPTRTRLF